MTGKILENDEHRKEAPGRNQRGLHLPESKILEDLFDHFVTFDELPVT